MRGGLVCMVETEIQSPEFDETSGNWLCLDFTHTKDGRFSDHPRELLNSPGDLVSWGLHMRLLTDEHAQYLLEEAARYPAQAAEVLQRAIDLREAIYRVFLEAAEGS